MVNLAHIYVLMVFIILLYNEKRKAGNINDKTFLLHLHLIMHTDFISFYNRKITKIGFLKNSGKTKLSIPKLWPSSHICGFTEGEKILKGPRSRKIDGVDKGIGKS